MFKYNLVQEFQDLVRCDITNSFCAEFLAKFGKDCLVSRNRIFFVNSICDNPARVFPLA
jgi:hypothetical protein